MSIMQKCDFFIHFAQISCCAVLLLGKNNEANCAKSISPGILRRAFSWGDATVVFIDISIDVRVIRWHFVKDLIFM